MRELIRDGIQWLVREMDATAVHYSRGGRCLIFDSEAVVRRVWDYPDSWRTLSDDQLWALVSGVAHVVAPTFERHEISWIDERRAFALAEETATRARALLVQIALLRDVNQRLRRENRELREACLAGRKEMRSVVETFAATMRQEGVAPEQAIVRIKGAIRGGVGPAIAADDPDAETMLHDAVSWGIAAYYAA